MKPTEIIFFAIAFLLPLVGGGVLLYLITRSTRARGDIDAPRKPAPPADATEPRAERETPEEDE
jgi:hypothetical protein